MSTEFLNTSNKAFEFLYHKKESAYKRKFFYSSFISARVDVYFTF